MGQGEGPDRDMTPQEAAAELQLFLESQPAIPITPGYPMARTGQVMTSAALGATDQHRRSGTLGPGAILNRAERTLSPFPEGDDRSSRDTPVVRTRLTTPGYDGSPFGPAPQTPPPIRRCTTPPRDGLFAPAPQAPPPRRSGAVSHRGAPTDWAEQTVGLNVFAKTQPRFVEDLKRRVIATMIGDYLQHLVDDKDNDKLAAALQAAVLDESAATSDRSVRDTLEAAKLLDAPALLRFLIDKIIGEIPNLTQLIVSGEEEEIGRIIEEKLGHVGPHIRRLFRTRDSESGNFQVGMVRMVQDLTRAHADLGEITKRVESEGKAREAAQKRLAEERAARKQAEERADFLGGVVVQAVDDARKIKVAQQQAEQRAQEAQLAREQAERQAQEAQLAREQAEQRAQPNALEAQKARSRTALLRALLVFLGLALAGGGMAGGGVALGLKSIPRTKSAPCPLKDIPLVEPADDYRFALPDTEKANELLTAEGYLDGKCRRGQDGTILICEYTNGEVKRTVIFNSNTGITPEQFKAGQQTVDVQATCTSPSSIVDMMQDILRKLFGS